VDNGSAVHYLLSLGFPAINLGGSMWDKRYAESGFAFGTKPNDFLKEHFSQIPKGGRVLCLAEGEGRNGVFLASEGFEVTGVDQSSVGLDKAKKLAAEKGVEINTIVSDLRDFDLGLEQWDGIVSIFTHLPTDLRTNLHRRVVTALKPKGVFILEAYTLAHIKLKGVGGPPPTNLELFMSLETLKKELDGLEILTGQETSRYISEGKYHKGDSGVVQLVAKR